MVEDKINYQAENIIRIKEIRRKAKNIIAKNILAGSAFGIATLISIIISTLVFTAVATSVRANFVLVNALVENIKIQKCNILERKYTWSWSTNLEETKKLRKELGMYYEFYNMEQ